MTAAELTLAALAESADPMLASAIRDKIGEQSTEKAIEMALTKLSRVGKIIRVARGTYALPANVDPAAAWVPRQPRQRAAAPAEDSAPIEPDPDAPAPLVWALWSDGDVLLRRGETDFALTADEFARLAQWHGRIAA